MPPSEELLREQVLDEIIADVRSGVPDDEDVRRAVDAVRERIARNAEQSAPMSKRRSFVRRHFGKLCLAAAAAIGIVIVLPFRADHTPGPGVAWAEVVKTFEAARTVHAVHTARINGEEKRMAEAWVRKPDRFRIENEAQIIIDNGADRVTIDKVAQTAQWSDSPLAYDTGEFDRVFRTAMAFREGLGPKYVPTKVEDECTDTRIVYLLDLDEAVKSTIKFWVQADSLLIERMVQTVPDGSGMGMPGPVTFDLVFRFDPIPEDVFTPSVPEGYEKLPRLERGKLMGRVLDEQGEPVPGADVYVTSDSAPSSFAAAERANEQGEFTVTMDPPGAPHASLSFPVFVRAFSEEDPARVAWTLLRSPDDNTQLAGTIPGEPGQMETDRKTGQPRCVSASGIVLRMEPATYVAGRVTGMDGQPIPRAEVTLEAGLMDEFGSEGHYVSVNGPGETLTRTDEDGRYRLTQLPVFWKGAWLDLRVEAAGHAPRNRRLVIGKDWSRDAMDFQLYRADWTVTGRLIDDHGVPLADRLVTVLVHGERVPRPYQTTDAEGGFRLDNCPSTPGLQLEAELNNDPPPHPRGNVPDPWYYLNVIKEIEPVAGQTQCEVDLVAQRPAITLNVTVRNSAGQPLPYFPVEVRGDGISLGWQWAKLQLRSDAQGRCTFTGVPRANNLHLRLYSGTTKPDENLDDAVRKIAEEYKNQYQAIIDLPIELRPGRTTFTLDATVPTREEYREQKNKPASKPSPGADLG